ncbi:hypothetical protein KEM54_000559 [Ascosphaera aggregata]|nr:hypothetical protein KEM54_000559 [Ascosphaera aggregata]
MGPESPQYVNVPAVLQNYMPRKTQPKGVLPVPRELFPPRRPDKPGSAYFAAVTPEPSPDKKVNVPKGHKDYDLLQWKKRMAKMRRANLREGLVELYARKKQVMKKVSEESARKQKEREAILCQPERDDERLTKPTTVSAMEVVRGVIPNDPSAARELQRRRLKYQWLQQKKMHERQDMLHTLYMNARHFITTEKQLEEHLNQVFSKMFSSDSHDGDSIWVTGAPNSVKDMLNTPKLGDFAFLKQGDRLKKIAETLTGGTM